jgi:hypothetical protein
VVFRLLAVAMTPLPFSRQILAFRTVGRGLLAF